ncbi:MAG: class I adenylate-forming enzyme family protein [Pseudomonadota bacterium]
MTTTGNPFSLAAVAAAEPERTALVAGGRSYSFRSLLVEQERAVAWLLAHGVASGQRCRIALVARPSLDTLVMIYALLELGVTIVPIHPRLTPVERHALLELVAPDLLVPEDWRAADAADAVAADAVAAAAAAATSSIARSGLPAATTPAPGRDSPGRDGCAPLAIIFTSGTGGSPKGVVLSRAAFVASARGSEENLGWQDGDRWLLAIPPAHIGGFSIITRCLLGRRAVVLAASDSASWDAALRQAVEHDRVTILSLVPAQLAVLIGHEPRWDPPGWVRAILAGGDAVSPALLGAAVDRGWPVLTTYGLTEACSQVTTQRLGTSNRGEQGAGSPIAGMEVRIVDGLIQVRGPALMAGYHPAELSAQPFTPDGWLRTDDRGQLGHDGRLHLLGRAGDLVVSGGENVDPTEVEQVLGELPGIAEAVVFGVDHGVWGQVVAAAVTLAPPAAAAPGDCQATAPAIARHVATRLASYKRPRLLAVVTELPRSPNGKLSRRAIATAVRDCLRPLP